MPLVRTEMIAPTKLYEHVPTLDPDEAAELVVEAMIDKARAGGDQARPVRRGRTRDCAGHGRIILNTAFRMFPESAAARGEKEAESRRGRSDRVHAVAERPASSDGQDCVG